MEENTHKGKIQMRKRDIHCGRNTEKGVTRRGGTWIEVHTRRGSQKRQLHMEENHTRKKYIHGGEIHKEEINKERRYIFFFLPVLLLYATRWVMADLT